jgi:hypothetical protein
MSIGFFPALVSHTSAPHTHTHTLLLLVNPFQSRDVIWHHTFNSVLHMLQFWRAGITLSSPKRFVPFLGWKGLTIFSRKNCGMWRTELKVWCHMASLGWKGLSSYCHLAKELYLIKHSFGKYSLDITSSLNLIFSRHGTEFSSRSSEIKIM